MNASSAPAPEPVGPASPSEADVRFALVRQRYGERLTMAQLDAVRQGVEALVESAAALRAVRLDNADEPFVTFCPDPWP